MSDTAKAAEVSGPTDGGKRTAHDYNIATWQYHLPKEIMRMGDNYEILKRLHKSGNAMGIQDAPKAAPGTPCIVIGSGPSADKVFPLLKDWRGGVICSTSQGMTLRRWGIEPDYMIALDSDSPAAENGPPSLWKGTKTALVSQPGVRTDLVEYWRWKSYWFRKYEPVADEPRIFYQMVQPLVFHEDENETWIKTQFVMLASVAPALCFLAKLLGYSPVFLSGVEFGWRDPAHSRFQSWSMEKGKWTQNPVPLSGMASNDRPEAVPYQTDNGAWTMGIQEFYKRNFLLALRLDQWPVWDIGGEGALSEVPRLDPQAVVKAQGQGFTYPPLPKVDALYDRYLAKHNTYVVKWNGGMNFVESNDWKADFPRAFGEAKRQGSKDADLLSNMRRFAAAHGETPTPEQEAEWLGIMEKVSKAKDIKEALKIMDARLMALVHSVDGVRDHPSLGVIPEVKAALLKMDDILKGRADV